MEAAGMPKKEASSMRIPYGVQTTLYSDDNFQGDSYLVTGPFYTDTTLEGECVNLKNDVDKTDFTDKA